MTSTRKQAARKATAENISTSLVKAIAEQRIAPGARLVEDELGSAFGVSRTVVRQALTQLAAQGLVGVVARRGWFVIEPSETEVQHAFAARRLIEAAVVREFIRVATPKQTRALRSHLLEQHDAVDGDDAPRRTHLLGDFHVRIADMLGNPHLVRVIADLVTRTNLMSMLYQSQQAASHSADEHEDILRAIERGDAAEAVRQMDRHLRNVEAGLQKRKPLDPVARLQQTLAVAPAEPVPQTESRPRKTARRTKEETR